MDDFIGVVAICGDEGTGKTTMALTFPFLLFCFLADFHLPENSFPELYHQNSHLYMTEITFSIHRNDNGHRAPQNGHCHQAN